MTTSAASDSSSDADITEFIGLNGFDENDLATFENEFDEDTDVEETNNGKSSSVAEPLFSLREVEICVVESDGERLKEILTTVETLVSSGSVDGSDAVVTLQVEVLKLAVDVSCGRFMQALRSPLIQGLVEVEDLQKQQHTVSRVKNREARFLHERIVAHVEKGIGSCIGRPDFKDPAVSSPDRHVNQRVLRAFSCVLLGAACLGLYMQANWTGPPIRDEDLTEMYPLPFIRGIYDEDRISKTKFLETALSNLSADAKAKAALSGKKVEETDLDQFPALHARCALMLGANGEEIYRDAKLIHYLHVARIVLRAVANPSITPGAVDPLDMLANARLEQEEEEEGFIVTSDGTDSKDPKGQKAKPFQELISGPVRQAVIHLVSAHWWASRTAACHQESLESQEFAAPSLAQEAERGLERTLQSLERTNCGHDDKSTVARLWCERGVIMHKMKIVEKAKAAFAKAQTAAGLTVTLSGAWGKRTKFQKDEKSQLILLASSDSTVPNSNVASTESIDSKSNHLAPSNTEQQGKGGSTEEEMPIPTQDWGIDYGKETVVGVSTVRLEEIDKDTPLHERIQFAKAENETEELQRFGTLSLLDQSIVLGLCMDVQNSYAMEGLTAEEMLAYVERIAVSAKNWQIYSCALFIKSQLEFERSKTKERSVLQMQVLVDQQSNRLTPLQTRQEEVDNSAPVDDRLRWVHALAWPPLWGLKRELAQRYLELGVAGSALKIFEEIHMWEEAVDCLVILDRKGRAEILIQERLEIQPSANLMCVMGNLKRDEEWYRKAWDFSNGRYARAKRLWAILAFEKGEFRECIKHLHDALNINPLYPGSWFRLGTAAMRVEEWNEARVAFATVIKQEPEDGDAYANLSSVLVKMNDYQGALQAISGAVRFSRDNAKIWDNFITLSLETRQWGGVLEGISHLIDIRRKVDVQAFVLVIDAIVTLDKKVSKKKKERDVLGRSTAGEEEEEEGLTEVYVDSLKDQLLQLFAKVKEKCSSDQNVWKGMAMYYSQIQDHLNKRDCLLRRVRAVQKEDMWERDDGKTDRVVMIVKDLFETFQKDIVEDLNLDESGKKQVATEASSIVRSTINRISAGTLPAEKGDPLRALLEKISEATQ